MNTNILTTNIKTGTCCGTILSILNLVHMEDLVHTVIVAAVGATVSFLVSFLLQKLSAHCVTRKNKKGNI